MTSQLPFDPERKEWLRDQLEDLLAKQQAGDIRPVDAIESLLVALLGALGDRPPVRNVDELEGPSE